MKVRTCLILVILSSCPGGSAWCNAGESPVTLAAALRQARERNPAMIEARKGVEAAEGVRGSVSLLDNPEMEGAMSVGDDPGLDEIEVWQPVPLPGSRRLARREVSHRIEARRQDVRGAWAAVYSRVREAFDKLVLDRRVIDLHGRKLETIRIMYGRVQLDHQSGRKLRGELLRAGVALNEAESELASAERDLKIDTAALNLLLGRSPTDPLDAAAALEEPETGWTLEELLVRARENRPDLRAAAEEAAGRAVALKRERLARWPSPALGWRNSAGHPGRENAVLLGMGIPLWNLNSGNIARAGAEREMAEAELEGIGRRAAFEVYEAHLDVELARKRFDLSRDLLAGAGELTRLASLRYQEGDIGLLEFLDQVDAGSGAQVEHARRLFDLNVAVTRLERAVHCSLRKEDFLR